MMIYVEAFVSTYKNYTYKTVITITHRTVQNNLFVFTW